MQSEEHEALANFTSCIANVPYQRVEKSIHYEVRVRSEEAVISYFVNEWKQSTREGDPFLVKLLVS